MNEHLFFSSFFFLKKKGNILTKKKEEPVKYLTGSILIGSPILAGSGRFVAGFEGNQLNGDNQTNLGSGFGEASPTDQSSPIFLTPVFCFHQNIFL